MTVVTAPASPRRAAVPVSPPALRVRAIRACKRGAARAVAAARRGAGNAVGVGGLVMLSVGAGAEFGWPWGLMVGGGCAVWFASLLGEDEPEAKEGRRG